MIAMLSSPNNVSHSCREHFQYMYFVVQVMYAVKALHSLLRLEVCLTSPLIRVLYILPLGWDVTQFAWQLLPLGFPTSVLQSNIFPPCYCGKCCYCALCTWMGRCFFLTSAALWEQRLPVVVLLFMKLTIPSQRPLASMFEIVVRACVELS